MSYHPTGDNPYIVCTPVDLELSRASILEPLNPRGT
jgi:hypothetical protein